MLRRLLRWFSAHGRDFFWREGPSSLELTRFRLLLVEFLLWKTNAARSHELIAAIVRRYRHPRRVLLRSVAQLEDELRPLGLFRRRASCLRAFAAQLIEEHGGEVPRDPDELQRLTGIGQYAARATACVLDGSRLMPVDANTSRLFGRLFGIEGPGVRKPGRDWDERLDPFVPQRAPRRFLWAVMDLCAAHCKARTPDCAACPLLADCATGSASRD